jgi:hypothetical protein
MLTWVIYDISKTRTRLPWHAAFGAAELITTSADRVTWNTCRATAHVTCARIDRARGGPIPAW